MKIFKVFVQKITQKKDKANQSLLSQKNYKSEEISIDQIPLPYGRSILSMTKYSTK